jgi:tetratricopeptide (TPR) repeat protein
VNALAALLLVASLGTPARDMAEARRLTKRSMREYNSGDFDRALADIKSAYDLSGLPGLLFNLGQCHRALGHWKEAEFSYRAYLRESPNPANREQVLTLIDQMEKQQAAAASSPPPPLVIQEAAPVAAPASETPHAVPAAAVEAPAPRRRVPVATWVVGALGVAAGLAGGVAWGIAGSERSGYASSGPLPANVTYAGVQQSNGLAVAGDVLVPVGGVLVAVAAGLALFAPAHEAPSP